MATRRRKITVVTTGRTDIDSLFEVGGVLQGKRTHFPFLAFLVEGALVRVQVCESAEAVKRLPPETPVMVQWEGRWRSDWFQLTAGDVLAPEAAVAALRERRLAIAARRETEPECWPADEARRYLQLNAYMERDPKRAATYAQAVDALRGAPQDADGRAVLVEAGLEAWLLPKPYRPPVPVEA